MSKEILEKVTCIQVARLKCHGEVRVLNALLRVVLHKAPPQSQSDYTSAATNPPPMGRTSSGTTLRPRTRHKKNIQDASQNFGNW